MNVRTVAGVRIAGLASAVPERTLSVEDVAAVFGPEEAKRISASTGITVRHVVPPGMCTSDLCFAAAERLLAELRWERAGIDTLIFVSQFPDYRLPATSCCLQERLGFGRDCAAFDINLGCSGYIYGLWAASGLIAGGTARRVLLLVGDTPGAPASPYDRSVAALFGDAGTATAIEAADVSEPMRFVLGTDGSGYAHLIVPAGGARHPSTADTRLRVKRQDGSARSDEDLSMNGAEVFAFTLRHVPQSIEAVMAAAGWELGSVDAYVMHQANKFMLQHLAKKMRLPPESVVLALDGYGNTSSASVPLAISDRLCERVRNQPNKLVLSGFGVGFSWGAVALTLGPAVAPDVIQVSSDAIWKDEKTPCSR